VTEGLGSDLDAFKNFGGGHCVLAIIYRGDKIRREEGVEVER